LENKNQVICKRAKISSQQQTLTSTKELLRDSSVLWAAFWAKGSSQISVATRPRQTPQKSFVLRAEKLGHQTMQPNTGYVTGHS